MGKRKSLPQHGMPNPALCLMLEDFTEKKLRRLARLGEATGRPKAHEPERFISRIDG